jgi:lysine decarboxylase
VQRNNKQDNAPILQALNNYLEKNYVSFHIPGHKNGQLVDQELLAMFQQQLFCFDLTELPGLDDLHQPEGPIEEAQKLGAQLFGAEETFFLVNGTSCGIEAGILSLCRDGEEIIVPRNVHQSVAYGLILSGAIPRYVPVEVCPKTGLALGPSLFKVEETLKLYPKAKGLVLVNPTYQGVAPALKDLVKLAHHADLPVLIDEAHGSHFCFSSSLPPSGLEAGGDLVVQSTHKLLGSLTQTSLLHVQGRRINRIRLKGYLKMVQTSSPSYLLMASLDGARRNMALKGKKLWEEILEEVREIRRQINALPGLDLLDEEDLKGTGFLLDPTKLVISPRGIGLSGEELAKILREKYRIQPEYADNNHVLLIVTPGNSREDLNKLVVSLVLIAKEYGEISDRKVKKIDFPNPPIGKQEVSPREAYNRQFVLLPLPETIGEIAAELVCPYPPGIPVVCPGEKITAEAVDYLRQAREVGAKIRGLDKEGRIAILS